MILIPVKNLANAKQRLSAVLNPEQRNALACAMLEDVLDAVAEGRHGQPAALVTGDSFALQLAKQHCLQVIEDRQNLGETAAIEMATAEAVARGANFTLVLPGDIPLMQPEELATVLASAPARGCVLVPSHDRRGTNAVLRRPCDLFPVRFGNDSFLPHLASAQTTSAEVVVLQLAGIALDIDHPADLLQLMAAGKGTRSERVLAQWGVPEALRKCSDQDGKSMERSA